MAGSAELLILGGACEERLSAYSSRESGVIESGLSAGLGERVIAILAFFIESCRLIATRLWFH